MPDSPPYRAAKSKSHDRAAWCVLFRHPLRKNGRGKPLRVRRGLNTKAEKEADILVQQLNRLLQDRDYWTPTARERALREFDARVVDIFYSDIDAKFEDPWTLRDRVLPLPGPSSGYARVLVLGPTGAGKTTLVRQLIGSHPRRDRFPSTSTAKTTIFDTEIIVAPLPYEAVVSFMSQDRVRHYLEECLVAAVSKAADGGRDNEALRHLLEHADQRFRLNYVLGSVAYDDVEEVDSTDRVDEVDDNASEQAELSAEEQKKLAGRLDSYLRRVRSLADARASELEGRLGIAVASARPADKDAFLELLEDALKDDEEAQELIDDLIEDIQERFEHVHTGKIETDNAGWPSRWTIKHEDRATFLASVNRFSSNYAPNFGRLLTPLVQGLRVKGPFRPADWYSEADLPKLVLMDGEGIGHAADSASSVSTAITKRYADSDVILLVDNATQPMVAATQAVLRSLATSGHASKLAVAFTHFDRVTGDNLPNEAMKRNHVKGSLNNAINAIDTTVNAGLGRALRRFLDARVLFLGAIDAVLPPQRKATRTQLAQLLNLFSQSIAQSPLVAKARPVYDMAYLVIGATAATRQFHEIWDQRLLGEHWSVVKALTRRLGYLGEDQYKDLKPLADLIRTISEQARNFIGTPRSWNPYTPSEEERQAAIDAVAREFFSRVQAFADQHLWMDHLKDWQAAFDRRGPGSGNSRKTDVRMIHGAAAPVLGVAAVPEASEFLDTIRQLFRDAATAAGADVIG